MPSAHPSIGFQAVILCGPGTSLYPFTGSEDLPKALLPIANKPMLHYPLEWCEKAGFDCMTLLHLNIYILFFSTNYSPFLGIAILILTLTEHHTAIQSYLRSHKLQKSSLYIQVEPASSLNENLGTADVLRIAYKKGWIKTDFAVLPCDLVTNLDAQEVAQLWMVEQAGFDADMGLRSRKSCKAGDADEGRRGGLGVWYETRGEGAVKGQETDFLALAPIDGAKARKGGKGAGSLSQLLFTLPGDALKGGSGGSQIELRRSLLRKHPNLQLYTTRRDSGIYFFPHWVLKFIDKNPKLNSIREDVLPWWSKSCWQNQRLAAKLGLLEILQGNADGGDDDSEDGSGERYEVGGMSSTRRRSFSNQQNESERLFASRVPATSKEAAAIARANLWGKKEQVQIPSITAYLPSAPTAFMRRVDTVHLYLFTSLYLAKSDPSVPSTQIKIDPSASIDPKAKVTSFDCLIADKVSIGEKALIKRSVLGSGVSIGKGVRLTGCVLMDGASIAEGAKLEGCTIGRKAIVGVKASLKDCEVAEGFVVEEGGESDRSAFWQSGG